MKNVSHFSVESMKPGDAELLPALPTLIPQAQTHSADDRYPGSFFRVPGVPMPGKTVWSLNK